MRPLQLNLLGQFDCSLGDDERLALPTRKIEVLLAYLALVPGLRHPRERLINLLWSDRGEEQARNSLRQALSTLRKALGDSADLILQIDRTTVSLKPELIEIDVHEFERLALEGDYESLATAADLYQGEFLEGVSIRDPACQEWLDGERTRFKRQLIEILTNLTETQLFSHDYNHAIHSAERLVRQDPLNEAGWRLLMRSYADHGDRNHALQAFKRCQQTLRDELEVEPDTATLELRDRIAGGQTTPKPVAANEKPRARPVTSTDHSIVVLPFDNLSGDPEQEYFSDGITDSIILNLSLFPGLNVKSRNSSFACKQQIKSLGEISRELDVDYVVEGSIRKSGDRIRITVQLIEAVSGNQVWGKRYDAELDNLFDLEEDLSRSIAATVTGQIESDLQRIAVAKGAAGRESYDLLLSGLYHALRYTPKDSLIAIDKLQQCLAQDPDNVRAHVYLYSCHSMSYLERWVEDYRASFARAAEHIKRALALNPESALVQAYYAEYLIFNDEANRARVHLDKALQINPNDTDALTVKAFLLENIGEFEAALKLIDRSLQLDPYHPWAEWELAVCNYYCGNYETAIQAVDNSRTSPSFTRIFSVASNLKLGRPEAARQALRTFLAECRENMKSMPQTVAEWTTYIRDNYVFKDPGLNESLMDCLVQAGLEEELAKEKLADETPSIAVLPFENMSGDPEQEHFSDGITADIIDTLSKFKHMRTVSRYSTMAYKFDKPPIARIAEQQKVGYILEGNVRKSGNRVRVNAELIDATSEAICWSERFDREIDDLFAVQDEITQQIVLALKVQLDDGEMALHRSGTTNIKAWELVLTAIDLQDTYIRKKILEARAMAQQAIELDPDYAYAWICLAWTFWQEVYSGWSESFDESMAEATRANQRSQELNPEYSEVWSQAGAIHTMNHEAEQALECCRKAVKLEPGNAETQALMAHAYIFNGEYEQAREHIKQTEKLCPVLPNWYYSIASQVEYYTGNLDQAVQTLRQGIDVEPDSPLCRFYLVDILMESGDEAGARQYADEIRSLDRDVAGRGFVRSQSIDPDIRNRFRANLEKFDLY